MKVIQIEDIPARVPPKHYDLLGRTIVDETTGKQDFRVVYTRMQKTGRCDPHVHEHAEQLFIVLKGAMMFQGDQGEILVREGQAVFVKRGEVHSNYNIAEGETEYITVTGISKV